MQATAKGEDGGDDCTDTGDRGTEAEDENTRDEGGEQSDTDPVLQQRPQPADAESHTGGIKVGTGTDPGRRSTRCTEPEARHRARDQDSVQGEHDGRLKAHGSAQTAVWKPERQPACEPRDTGSVTRKSTPRSDRMATDPTVLLSAGPP